jgi:hypothetical protein
MNGRPIILAMGVGAESDMLPHAVSYLGIRALGTPGATMWLVINGIYRGLGDTATPLKWALVFTGLNGTSPFPPRTPLLPPPESPSFPLILPYTPLIFMHVYMITPQFRGAKLFSSVEHSNLSHRLHSLNSHPGPHLQTQFVCVRVCVCIYIYIYIYIYICVCVRACDRASKPYT